MYEETREIIKDTLRIPLTIGDRPYLISDILEHIMIGYIFEVEIEQIADQVLAILLTPAQIAEWKAGGKVAVIARDHDKSIVLLLASHYFGSLPDGRDTFAFTQEELLELRVVE